MEQRCCTGPLTLAMGSAHADRWALRITGLLPTSKDSLARTSGLTIAFETIHQSQAHLLSHGKGWFNAALSMLAVRRRLSHVG